VTAVAASNGTTAQASNISAAVRHAVKAAGASDSVATTASAAAVRAAKVLTKVPVLPSPPSSKSSANRLFTGNKATPAEKASMLAVAGDVKGPAAGAATAAFQAGASTGTSTIASMATAAAVEKVTAIAASAGQKPDKGVVSAAAEKAASESGVSAGAAKAIGTAAARAASIAKYTAVPTPAPTAAKSDAKPGFFAVSPDPKAGFFSDKPDGTVKSGSAVAGFFTDNGVTNATDNNTVTEQQGFFTNEANSAASAEASDDSKPPAVKKEKSDPASAAMKAAIAAGVSQVAAAAGAAAAKNDIKNGVSGEIANVVEKAVVDAGGSPAGAAAAGAAAAGMAKHESPSKIGADVKNAVEEAGGTAKEAMRAGAETAAEAALAATTKANRGWFSDGKNSSSDSVKRGWFSDSSRGDSKKGSDKGHSGGNSDSLGSDKGEAKKGPEPSQKAVAPAAAAASANAAGLAKQEDPSQIGADVKNAVEETGGSAKDAMAAGVKADAAATKAYRTKESKDAFAADVLGDLNNALGGASKHEVVTKPVHIAPPPPEDKPANRNSVLEELEAVGAADPKSVAAVEAGFEAASATHYDLGAQGANPHDVTELTLAANIFNSATTPTAVSVSTHHDLEDLGEDMGVGEDNDSSDASQRGAFFTDAPNTTEKSDVAFTDGASNRTHGAQHISSRSSVGSEQVVCQATQVIVCKEVHSEYSSEGAVAPKPELSLNGVLHFNGDTVAKEDCAVESQAKCKAGCSSTSDGILQKLGGTCVLDIMSKLDCGKCDPKAKRQKRCYGERLLWKKGVSASTTLLCDSSVTKDMVGVAACGCNSECSKAQIAQCSTALFSAT